MNCSCPYSSLLHGHKQIRTSCISLQLLNASNWSFHLHFKCLHVVTGVTYISMSIYPEHLLASVNEECDKTPSLNELVRYVLRLRALWSSAICYHEVEMEGKARWESRRGSVYAIRVPPTDRRRTAAAACRQQLTRKRTEQDAAKMAVCTRGRKLEIDVLATTDDAAFYGGHLKHMHSQIASVSRQDIYICMYLYICTHT